LDILQTAERILIQELPFQGTDFIESVHPYVISEDQHCEYNRHVFGHGILRYKKQGCVTIVKNIGNWLQDWATGKMGS
jgi:hypothetical protein